MAGMAQVQLIGRLGADPEVKFGQSGSAVCRLRVAVSDKRKKDGEWQEHTQWFGVAIFGKQGESAGQYLRKGRQVWLQGRLEAREYQAKDGTTKTALEVACSAWQALGPKEGGEAADPTTAAPSTSTARPSGKSASSSTAPADDWRDEELPF